MGLGKKKAREEALRKLSVLFRDLIYGMPVAGITEAEEAAVSKLLAQKFNEVLDAYDRERGWW